MVCIYEVYSIYIFPLCTKKWWSRRMNHRVQFASAVPSNPPNARTHVFFSRQFGLLEPSFKGRPSTSVIGEAHSEIHRFFHKKSIPSPPFFQIRVWTLVVSVVDADVILGVSWSFFLEVPFCATLLRPTSWVPQVSAAWRGKLFVGLQLHPKTLGRSRSISTDLAKEAYKCGPPRIVINGVIYNLYKWSYKWITGVK